MASYQVITHFVFLAFIINFAGNLPGAHSLGAVTSVPFAELPTKENEEQKQFLHTIQLFKQYVPIEKQGKTVAYKTSYFGQVSLGATHPQVFTAVFDTGSGHVILPSVSCRSETCRKHRRFNSRLSTSAVDVEGDGTPILANATTRDQLTVAFGTGKVTGDFVEDLMCLGGSEGVCFNIRMVMATDMTHDPFGFFDFDGVIGLGFDALTLNEHFNFLKSVTSQHTEMLPQFSVFLARTEDDISVISFGGHDPERAQTEMVWTPVADPELGYWQVKIEAIRIGNETLQDCMDGTCRAILDSGTSLFGVPREISKPMHRLLARHIPAEEYSESIDCRTVPGHMLHFDLAGGTTVSLNYDDYSRPAPVNLTVADSDEKQAYCRALLLPVDLTVPLSPKAFIFGEPMLRRYYTGYNMVKKEVGFALAKPRAMRSSEKESQPIDLSLTSSMASRMNLEVPTGSLAIGAPLPAASPADANSTAVTV